MCITYNKQNLGHGAKYNYKCLEYMCERREWKVSPGLPKVNYSFISAAMGVSVLLSLLYPHHTSLPSLTHSPALVMLDAKNGGKALFCK